ncbi:MAG: DUF47 family protein [Myxococcota bacterium]
MGIQSFIRWFLPREDKFFDYIEQQAVFAHRGAQALAGFGGVTDGSSGAISAAVQVLEHEGDRVVHEMEEALAKTFVTPLDREDLQRLSMELDDVLDLTNGAARGAVLYGVERPTMAMTALIELLVKCTAILAEALPGLRRHAYPTLLEHARELRRLEKEADQIFRADVSRLFHGDEDAREIFRQKAVLDDLEMAIDHCEHVGSTLAHLAVKHG